MCYGSSDVAILRSAVWRLIFHQRNPGNFQTLVKAHLISTPLSVFIIFYSIYYVVLRDILVF